MSDLMIIISTLGGLSLFGATGFVVGPIVAAVFVTLWDVYGRAFSDALPPVGRIISEDNSASTSGGATDGGAVEGAVEGIGDDVEPYGAA